MVVQIHMWLMVWKAGAALRRAGAGLIPALTEFWGVRNGLKPWGGGDALSCRVHSSVEGCGEAVSCWPFPSAPARGLVPQERDQNGSRPWLVSPTFPSI